MREQMQAAVVPTLRPYASRIELFGSAARGEASAESDIDLLVALRPEGERPPLGLRWFALERELSEKLGRPVELVTEKAISCHVLPYIQADRVVLYEE